MQLWALKLFFCRTLHPGEHSFLGLGQTENYTGFLETIRCNESHLYHTPHVDSVLMLSMTAPRHTGCRPRLSIPGLF